MRFAFALCLFGLVAGCAASLSDTGAVRTTPIAYEPDDRGIQVLGADGRIDFGRTDHSTLPAMTKLVGSPPVAQGSCAAGGQFASWSDGTRLHFLNGAFRGWHQARSDGSVRAAGTDCL